MRWIKDRIMDKDNDIETETDSVISSMTDVSIYHEFDQIMAELHSIQQLHHQTIQQCQQLSSSITTLTNDGDGKYTYTSEDTTAAPTVINVVGDVISNASSINGKNIKFPSSFLYNFFAHLPN